ncbi:MAG: hypothetical protein KA712_15540 [Myxococcales bacterium]|nr:hypothetical protein [Myxococcales bacterium]
MFCFLACVAVSLAAARFLPRTFRSEVVLLWEPADAADVLGSGRDLQTILGTLKLPENLGAIREALAIESTLDALAHKIEVRPDKSSNVVVLWAHEESAEAARILATQTVKVFLESRREMEVKRSEEAVASQKEALSKAGRDLMEAQAAYDGFRLSHGVWDLEAERDAAVKEVSAFRSDAYRSLVTAEAHQTKQGLMGAALKTEPSQVIVSETESRETLRRLAALRTDLAAKTAALTPDHPIVRGLEAAVRELESKGEGEVIRPERVLGMNQQREALRSGLTLAEVERRVSERQAAAFEVLEKRATERLERLATLEGRAAQLQSQLAAAKQRVIELEGTLAVAKAESLQPQVGFRIVSAPSLPIYPNRSYRRPAALVLPFALLGFVFAMAVVRFFLRLWPATPEEVAFWGGAPVVAAAGWPREPGDLEDLSAQLLGGLSEGGGSTAVVAACEEDQSTVRTLVSHLETRLVSARDGQSERVRLAVVDGEPQAKKVRRLTRAAARVLVVLRGGALSPWDLFRLRSQLGNPGRMAFVVIDLGPEFADEPEQVGEAGPYWAAYSPGLSQ